MQSSKSIIFLIYAFKINVNNYKKTAFTLVEAVFFIHEIMISF